MKSSLDSSNITLDSSSITLDSTGMTSALSVVMSCPTASSDGLYHCRYPHGDAIRAALSSAATESAIAAGTLVSSGGGATLQFSYPSGFSGAGGAISTAADATLGTVANLVGVGHTAGAIWYRTQKNIQSFTTNFTFQVTGISGPVIVGFTFCIQNTTSSSNPLAFGTSASADANCDGYGAFPELGSPQYPLHNSIAVKFDLGSGPFYDFPASGTGNKTGLYINGGFAQTLLPTQDLNALGISLNSGDTFACTLVYDGSILTMSLRDITSGAQCRLSWPVNIPACIGQNTAWVGFTGGQTSSTAVNLETWDYYTGYNTRLATPTFGVSPGQYSSTQSVSLSGPSGATIYYTTNGLPPTAASTQYSGAPISVSSNKIIQAVAVQSGFTDSLVAFGNYQIASSGTPLVNFPSGFASASNLISIVGRAALSGSSIAITDGLNPPNQGEVGGVWYLAPVNVSSAFTCNFQLNLHAGNARGVAFVLQNQPASSSDTSVFGVTGGPFALGFGYLAMGFAGNNLSGGLLLPGQQLGLANSVAIIFAPINGSGSYTGVYINGVTPAAGDGISVNIGSSVSFQSGHLFNVSLTYSGTTLIVSITDTTTSANYTGSFSVNIPSVVGASTAYAGFTGSDFGGSAQQVNNWTFT